MNTTSLVLEINAQRAAMTDTAKAKRQSEARRQWVALGGSAETFERINAAHFVSLSADAQAIMVKTLGGSNEQLT